MMEAFQVLSRGGMEFDKRRFRDDVQLFEGTEQRDSKIGEKAQTNNDLPPELDFFKYTQRNVAKRKSHQSDPQPEKDDGKQDDMIRKKVRIDSSGKEEGSSRITHRVSVKGDGVPEPLGSFEALHDRYDVSSRIIENLKEYGYISPTAIQSHAASIIMQGRDLAAISPTGTGKTLSYLIPVISSLKSPVSALKNVPVQGVRALILAPTRELAHQIYSECLKLTQGRKWRIILFSKATASTLSDKAARYTADVIISTPLRLVDSMRHGNLDLDNVRYLILDEADRLFDAEFISQTTEVISACTHDKVQKAFFSATLPAGAEKIAMGILRHPIRVIVGLKDTPLPSISQKLVYVADESSKLPTILQYLSQPHAAPIIIFTSTQSRASSLAEQLTLNDVQHVDCLHAGMTKKERQDAAARMKKGDTWIMISTEIMARGMDFKGVRGVVNLDFPTSIQSYIHRIGRTGRAGREGSTITYFTNEDAPYLKPIANVMSQSGSTVPEWIMKLPKLSKMKRRAMGKVSRGETVTKYDRIGRREAMKKRDMINASKRRRVRESK